MEQKKQREQENYKSVASITLHLHQASAVILSKWIQREEALVFP